MTFDEANQLYAKAAVSGDIMYKSKFRYLSSYPPLKKSHMDTDKIIDDVLRDVGITRVTKETRKKLDKAAQEEYNRPTKRIVQISNFGKHNDLVALCEDGSLWLLEEVYGGDKWYRIKGISEDKSADSPREL